MPDPTESEPTIHFEDSSEEFDWIYTSIAGSMAYHDAVSASLSGLPDWLVPFSVVDADLLARIAAELDLRKGDALIDLGCGAGGPGLWVADRTSASLVGIDYAPAAIHAAVRLSEQLGMSPQARFFVGDATATGLPQASVSGAMCIDAMMFMDAERVTAEIARILEPGGTLVATAAEALVEPFTRTIVRDYRPVLERAGFDIVVHEESDGHATRQFALYRAIEIRAGALRRELGEAAEHLLDEARSGLRGTDHLARVRHVFFVARRR